MMITIPRMLMAGHPLVIEFETTWDGSKERAHRIRTSSTAVDWRHGSKTLGHHTRAVRLGASPVVRTARRRRVAPRGPGGPPPPGRRDPRDGRHLRLHGAHR